MGQLSTVTARPRWVNWVFLNRNDPSGLTYSWDNGALFSQKKPPERTDAWRLSASSIPAVRTLVLKEGSEQHTPSTHTPFFSHLIFHNPALKCTVWTWLIQIKLTGQDTFKYFSRGLPRWLCKESLCQSRRHGFNPWVRKIPWQPILVVVLPGKSHAQRSLVGPSPWGCKNRTQHGN